MNGSPVSNQAPEQERVQPLAKKKSKRPSRTLELPFIPSDSHKDVSSTMSPSPTTTRRRATLTPYQAWRHATDSFFPPDPYVHDDVTSKSTTLNSNDVLTPASSGACISTTPYTTPTSGSRSRSGSYTGVHYSTAHRRVPSSPSFRSTLTLAPHTYFDRPPSPSSSVSSRCSEPPVSAGLSLSELLASTNTGSFGEQPDDEVEGLARRETQREERKQAMRERHAAIRERREREKWAKAQTRC
ncbi:hypothetical protein RhiXN_02668 [Rhizoctonia solani]|uniref:Uncharacterized protein n=1 Tax=Rhizoctonia solani TaxID=456999 RepID=A0A8H8SU16_9AGAM|nr:uncharacterized protein RhiXN_02668 [Rhizoctonia solani]QRW17744.1 hypothetical protein RhiXN_02668 [Rhizoctonia solani]